MGLIGKMSFKSFFIKLQYDVIITFFCNCDSFCKILVSFKKWPNQYRFVPMIFNYQSKYANFREKKTSENTYFLHNICFNF